MECWSLEQFRSNLATAADSQWSTVSVGDCGFVSVAQQVIGCGLHVFGADGEVGDVSAQSICGADDAAAGHATAGEDA